MTNEKKFNELLNDKDFVEEILSMETIEDVQAGFAQHGVEVSEDEVEKLGEIIEETSKKMSKLSDDELDQIAGGERPIWEDDDGTTVTPNFSEIKGIHNLTWDKDTADKVADAFADDNGEAFLGQIAYETHKLGVTTGAIWGAGITAGVAALAASGYAVWKKWGHKK